MSEKFLKTDSDDSTDIGLPSKQTPIFTFVYWKLRSICDIGQAKNGFLDNSKETTLPDT